MTLNPLILATSFPSAFCLASTNSKHDEVFIYVVGGVTFEEALHVHQLNESKDNPTGIRFILGGSCIHNSATFLDDVLGWADKDDVRIDVSSSATAAGGSAGSAASAGGKGKNKPNKFDG